MPQTNQHKKKLTELQKCMIDDCKDERKRLRKKADQFSDRALAKAFKVSPSTIRRV